jgi:acetate kinase
MKVLVLNSGSSSIKFALQDLDAHTTLASGLIEQIGETHSHDKIKFFDSEGVGQSDEHFDTIPNHKAGMDIVERLLMDSGLLGSFEELDGIGHRVVHGGEKFYAPALINEEVLDDIKLVASLAPLHNPANILGIEVAQKRAPKVPNVAVFDTAFHHSMPQSAYMYALPYAWYEKHSVRRYGFHGTSHFFVAKECAKLLQKPLQECNLVTLHLGNGASACAIKSGKSVDTSMGLTPLEGLMMGTRSGDMDPAIHHYIHQKEEISLDEVNRILNKKSGFSGVCGENDLRSIIEKVEDGDKRAKLALEIYAYRIKKYIGSYIASINGADAIVFTGGIGENAVMVRELVCKELEFLGIELDSDKNSAKDRGARFISRDKSRVKIAVIPTNEELEIALQTKEVIEKG